MISNFIFNTSHTFTYLAHSSIKYESRNFFQKGARCQTPSPKLISIKTLDKLHMSSSSSGSFCWCRECSQCWAWLCSSCLQQSWVIVQFMQLWTGYVWLLQRNSKLQDCVPFCSSQHSLLDLDSRYRSIWRWNQKMQKINLKFTSTWCF